MGQMLSMRMMDGFTVSAREKGLKAMRASAESIVTKAKVPPTALAQLCWLVGLGARAGTGAEAGGRRVRGLRLGYLLPGPSG